VNLLHRRAVLARDGRYLRSLLGERCGLCPLPALDFAVTAWLAARRHRFTLLFALSHVFHLAGVIAMSSRAAARAEPADHAVADVAAGFEVIAAGGVSVTCQFDSLK
jgi:hypothetical protein